MRINISHWNPPKGPQGKIRCNLPNPNIKTASLSLGFLFRKQKNDIIVTTILWPISVQPKLVNHSSTMTRALNGATWAKSSELRKQKCGRRIIFLEGVCKKEGRPGKGITVYDGLAANDLKTRQLQQRSYDRPPSFSPSEDVNCLLSSSCFLLHFLKFFSFFYTIYQKKISLIISECLFSKLWGLTDTSEPAGQGHPVNAGMPSRDCLSLYRFLFITILKQQIIKVADRHDDDDDECIAKFHVSVFPSN